MNIKLKGYQDLQSPGIVQMAYGWLGVEVHHGEMNVTFPYGDDDTFVPINFHFHAPSDHTIRGKHFDLEMHIVHLRKQTKGLGAVLTIPFDTKLGGNIHNDFIESLSPEKLNDDAEFIVLDEELNNGYYESEHQIRL
jgi:carbonic anhydrase